MDCDDVMLVIAARDRTLTGAEQDDLHRHLAGCASCRALSVEGDDHWRWVVRIPADSLDADGPVLPVVDPVVFDVGAELASGGMGRITRAYDRRLGRDVAIKEVLAPEMRTRFEREATITARLQHPAIVPIYEAGTWPNGSAFYTMRLVDGSTLAHAIAQAKTTPERIALLPHLVAATEALAYAHSRRIVHRDLKPGNVLVGAFGETVVIDWGLAKELDRPSATPRVAARPGDAGGFDRPGPDPLPGLEPSSTELTRVGSVLGTPGFMAPEQAAGEDVDERADVYALGAILYNVLCGVPPYFDTFASAARLVEIVRVDPPTPIAQLAPDAPADLHAIVERAMARDKEARYRTAKEMADELRRFEAGQLIAARAYTIRDLIARWIRRHRTAVVVGAVAALALAVVGVVALVDVTRSRASERDAREASERTTAALLEEQGRTEMLSGDRARALAYLAEAYRRGRDTPALRFLLADASRDVAPLLDTIAPPQLTMSCGDEKNCSGSDVASLGYTADGRLVLVEETGRISVWKDGKLLRAFAIGQFGSAQLDPGAQHAAVTHEHAVEMWDVERGEKVWRVDDAAIDRAELLFDAHGAKLLALPDDDDAKNATLRDAHTGEALGKVALDEHVTHAAFSPDGDALAAVGASGAAGVWGGAKLLRLGRFQATKQASSIAFAGDDLVVVGAPDAEIWRYSTGEKLHVLAGHTGTFITVASDGELIAVGDDAGVKLWTNRGEPLAESREPRGRIERFVFTSGALVGAGLDDRIYVWDTPTLERRAAIAAHDGWADLLAVSPTRIATSGLTDDRVKEWAMPLGHRVARIPTPKAVLAGDRFVSVTTDGTVVGRIDTGGEVGRIAVSGTAPRVQASRDGKRVLIAANEDVWIVDVGSAAPPRHLTWKGDRIVISADGRFLVGQGDRGTKHFARVFDAATGTKLFELTFGKREEPTGFDVSADGSRLAIGFTNAVKQWAIPSGAPLSTLALTAIKDADYMPLFAPAGTSLALTSMWLPNTVLVYDAATNALIAKIDDSGDVVEPVFSRDGRLVLTATERSLRLWDVRTGQQRASLEGTSKDAYAFSADGARIATGSGDGTLRVWDVETGRLLARFRGHDGAISSVEISDDGTRLLAVGKDGYATLWDIHLDRRSPDAIGELAARGVWRFDDGLVVPRSGPR